MPILINVKRLTAIVALVMLALWVPITMHCQLEKIPGLEFLHCSDDTSSHDCKGDGCQTVESGGYKVENNQAAIFATLNAVVLLETFLPLEPPPPAVAPFTVTKAVPPELPTCWQFFFRTALPPRAPSLAS